MKKVIPGNAIDIKAETWNNFIDAARDYKERQNSIVDGKNGESDPAGIIYIKNTTEEDLELYDCVVITGVETEPDESDPDSFDFEKVVYSVDFWDEEEYSNNDLCIFQEPIASGEIGRAMIIGITHADVYINNEEDLYASPDPDNNGKLTSSSDGKFKIIWKEEGTGEYKKAMLLLSGNGGSGNCDYPFKLYTGKDDDENPIIKMKEGSVYLQSIAEKWVHFKNGTCASFSDDEVIDFDWSSVEDDDYMINGWVTYDSEDEITCGILIMSDSYSDSYYLPHGCGFYSFLIGIVTKETDDDNNITLKIKQQLAAGHVTITDQYLGLPFVPFISVTVPDVTSVCTPNDVVATNAQLITMPAYDDSEKEFSNLTDSGQSLSTGNTYWCYIKDTDGTRTIQWSTEELDAYETEEDKPVIRTLVAKLVYNSNNTLETEVYHLAPYRAGSDTYKLKINDTDAHKDETPDFLELKLKGDTPASGDEDKYPNKGYIKHLVIDNNADPKNLYMKSVWDYKSIPGYDEDKKNLTIVTKDDGTLKWDNVIGKFVGSLDDYVEFHDNTDTGDKEIRWKNEYAEDKYAGVRLVLEDKNTNKLSIATMVPDDESLGLSANEWIMSWNCLNRNTWAGEPRVLIPPDSTEEIAQYCLCGNENGISWLAYDNMNIVLQGSMDDIFEITTDTEEENQKVLRVRSEYNGSCNKFHFLHLDETGKLDVCSFTSDSPQELMIWSSNNEPEVFQNPTKVEGKTYFLSGNKTDGLEWKEAESDGKVKVSEDDTTADYLFAKLESDDQSIHIEATAAPSNQKVDLAINPEYFTSEDGSVTFTSGLKLDLSAKKVAVTDSDDDPGYLGEKVVSENDSINVTTDGSTGESPALNLEINPEYFTSEDESVTITETEAGKLDLSAKKVAVTDSDEEPGYLGEKVVSENDSINVTTDGSTGESPALNIQINPEYFTSEDESVTITETEAGKLDLSARKVSVTSSDEEPGYLGEKVVSENDSINVTTDGSTGESPALNIQINPEYFTSEDESVTITETEAGKLDLSARKVSVTSSDEEPGYLGEKVVSENDSINVTTDGSTGESPALNIQINPEYFTSSDETITITETLSGKMDLKVKPEGIVALFESNDIIVFTVSDDKISAKLGENALESTNDSISLIYDDGTFDLSINPDSFTSSNESISITHNSGVFDFKLNPDNVFEDGIIVFQVSGDGTVSAELGETAVMADDDSITAAWSNGAVGLKVNTESETLINALADSLASNETFIENLADSLMSNQEFIDAMAAFIVQTQDFQDGVKDVMADLIPDSGVVISNGGGNFDTMDYEDCPPDPE